MVRLTKKRLDAMANAISAMLSGEEHQGDWSEDTSREDLEAAESWVFEQLRKRSKTRDAGSRVETVATGEPRE